MISSMREYFRSLKFILVVIIVAFIGTSVIYFGTAALSGGANKPNVVATVNGEEIPTERFRRAQASIIESYERMTRQRMTPELAERLGLNQQVINDLVADAVIVQSAEREGVRVTDEELRQQIQGMREFQEDGRFSRDRYLRILRQARLDAGDFETEMRRQLVRRKMEALVRDGVKVTDGEVRDAFRSRHERVRAIWAQVDVQPLLGAITVDDADLEPYVKAHQAQFTRPERRRLQYVVLSPRGYTERVSDQEVEQYYQDHGSEFEQPRRVHVAHILVRVPQVGGSEAENKAKAKIEAVKARARSIACASARSRLIASITRSLISASGGTPAGICSATFTTTNPARVLMGADTPPTAIENTVSSSWGSRPMISTASPRATVDSRISSPSAFASAPKSLAEISRGRASSAFALAAPSLRSAVSLSRI